MSYRSRKGLRRVAVKTLSNEELREQKRDLLDIINEKPGGAFWVGGFGERQRAKSRLAKVLKEMQRRNIS